jgi:hypothetical protein
VYMALQRNFSETNFQLFRAPRQSLNYKIYTQVRTELSESFNTKGSKKLGSLFFNFLKCSSRLIRSLLKQHRCQLLNAVATFLAAVISNAPCQLASKGLLLQVLDFALLQVLAGLQIRTQ